MATITVTVPTVTEYTVTPSRTSPTTFFADRETRLNEEATRIPEQNTQATALNTFKTQANAVRDEINDLLTTTQTSAGEAATSATNAGISALQASGSANFKGDWITLTAYTVGQSVYYSGNFYVCKTANSDATFTSSKWVINVPLGAVGNINNTLSEFSFKSSTAIDKGVGSTSYTRASKATYIDRYGKLKYLANDVAGFNRDGIIIEPASTNLLTHTKNFENAAWEHLFGGTGIDPVVTSNNVLSPAGDMTADTIVFNSGAGITSTDQSLVRQVQTTALTTIYSGSIWLKGVVGGEKIAVRHASNVGYTLLTLTTSWVRYSIVETGSTSTTSFFTIGIRQGVVGTINSSATVHIFGAQLEALPNPTNYIPSTETFTSRASTATYYDNTGTLQTAAIDTERLTYNPSDLTAPASQLFEGARTNSILYSEDFTKANWNGTASTGTTIVSQGHTLDLLTDNDGAVAEYEFQDVAVVNDSATHCTSLFVKQSGTDNKARITAQLLGGTSLNNSWVLDFSTLTASHVLDAGGEFLSFDDYGDGLYRISVKVTNNTSGNTSLRTAIYPAYLGVATDVGSVYAGGVQVELNSSYPTSYIPTTTTAVTRSADVYTSASSTRVAPLLTASAENIPNLNEDWTLSFDLKVNGKNSDSTVSRFLTVMDSAGTDFSLMLQYVNSTQSFTFYPKIDGVTTATVGTTATIGEKHSYSISFNRTLNTITLYKDRIYISVASSIGELPTSYSLFKLSGTGTSLTTTTATGNNQLSNIVWHDRCLTATEIALN